MEIAGRGRRQGRRKERAMMRHRVQCMIWVVTVLLSIPLSSESQSPRPKLEGMWSDPPSTAVGAFCTFACADAGLKRLDELLDNPANDARPIEELQAEAKKHDREYIRDKLTTSAVKTYPLHSTD